MSAYARRTTTGDDTARSRRYHQHARRRRRRRSAIRPEAAYRRRAPRAPVDRFAPALRQTNLSDPPAHMQPRSVPWKREESFPWVIKPPILCTVLDGYSLQNRSRTRPGRPRNRTMSGPSRRGSAGRRSASVAGPDTRPARSRPAAAPTPAPGPAVPASPWCASPAVTFDDASTCPPGTAEAFVVSPSRTPQTTRPLAVGDLEHRDTELAAAAEARDAEGRPARGPRPHRT